MSSSDVARSLLRQWDYPEFNKQREASRNGFEDGEDIKVLAEKLRSRARVPRARLLAHVMGPDLRWPLDFSRASTMKLVVCVRQLVS